MTLEDQIKAILESSQKEQEAADADKQDSMPAATQADRVDDEPAVKIENPMDPDLVSSEQDSPQGEIAAAELQGQKSEDEDEDKEKEQVKESISSLLGSEFSDEFKLTAETIFEAAVKDRVMQIEAKLTEEHEAKASKLREDFDEQLSIRMRELEEETSDKIDGYLNYLAEEWKKDNTISLESAIKTELTESFINGMKTLFEQHYFELPDEKVDLYSKALEEKAGLETALANTVGKLAKLTESVNQFKREQIITEETKDFSELDIARFKSLTEDFEFDDEQTFHRRVQIVKRSFFEGKQNFTREQITEDFADTPKIVVTESVVEETERPAMNAYLRALGKK